MAVKLWVGESKKLDERKSVKRNAVKKSLQAKSRLRPLFWFYHLVLGFCRETRYFFH